ncbi:MAG: hypothetical protein CO150_06730 [Nitrospirae bacterium CG_4_9_14_3_um_filter_53_35]|nr:MAG: hypothetical protein AUK29_06640 [Nitrospirae bacterium CG2_30_53_67]PIS36987.1 MAG: hypothetical protein COT35_08340 [Nitrospirae bacterium CG08_land_8_20_14_0_20_52_24]PIV85636.1 MAG: hypothetical protein COW52_01025 [Nitrospirae bacterium CG17_big_fil_post_rev_8_21_14_2_50_50_9]PIW85466.1 MAG: hypothetical protein COZ95_04385 [Nitrospirae bacterium CG_4_8_14_3_um_filter_50_41]PIX85739.1 MAG: hypothetical protein COZ32_06940 [Nitrospirae bacterium CG_4_10_14_3_um_filter_53_41]PJA7437
MSSRKKTGSGSLQTTFRKTDLKKGELTPEVILERKRAPKKYKTTSERPLHSLAEERLLVPPEE